MSVKVNLRGDPNRYANPLWVNSLANFEQKLYERGFFTNSMGSRLHNCYHRPDYTYSLTNLSAPL